MKKKDKIKFDDFVKEATRKIHSALLQGGGKEMERVVYLYIQSAIEYAKEGKF